MAVAVFCAVCLLDEVNGASLSGVNPSVPAIRLEERDVVEIHGDDYIEYRKRTPMLVPLRVE